jgi:hypothetical protein
MRQTQIPMLALIVLLAAWAAALQVKPAQAHGGGVPQLTGAEAGPYRVYAWTSPEPWRAGTVHIDVAVAKPAMSTGEVPVTDVQVFVRLVGPEGTAPIEKQAVPLALLNSFYYEAEFELPVSGLWQIEIDVTAQEGHGTTGFALEALPPRTVNWTLVGGGITVLFVVVALMAAWSRNATPQQAQKPGQKRKPKGTKELEARP